MSEKKAKKWSGHKRDGKAVVPVIFYAAPQVHRALKAKCKKLGTTQNAYLNLLATRSVGAIKAKKKAAKPVAQVEATVQ